MATRSTRLRKLPPRQQPEQQSPQSRAKWTTPLTQILVDLMVDEVHKGNKKNYSFGKKAWKSITDEFYKKTGLKWDKEQLKNRYAVLRKQYTIAKLLLEQSDFKWDETTGTITATDEVWDRIIKVRSFPICCLSVIWNKTITLWVRGTSFHWAWLQNYFGL